MKTATSFAMSVLVVAPLALGGVSACASDKNKQLDEAAAQEAEATRSARETQIEQTQKEQMKSIEANKKSLENAPQGSEQLAKAQADIVEERQKFQVESEARLQKAEARLQEARTKLRIRPGNADVNVDNKMSEAARMASVIQDEINHLPQVSNDNWSAEKTRLDKALSNLESTTDDVKSKADSAVP